MRRIYLYTAVILTLIYASCNNSQNIAEQTAMASSTEEISKNSDVDVIQLSSDAASSEDETKEINKNSSSQETITSNTTISAKKIVKTGNISIDAKDIIKTKEKLDNTIKQFGGYYEQENTSAGSTYTNYNLTVRIPSNQFDNFVKKLENGDDKITEKSIQAQDISIQYYDTESRIKSKRSYLDKYNQMVSSAKNINELLQIQEQIRQLQEDIESSESLLRNLAGQVNYSVVNINIFNSNNSGSAYQPSFLSQIGDSFLSGWELISSIFLGAITIWPVLLIIALSIFAWRKYKKRKKI